MNEQFVIILTSAVVSLSVSLITFLVSTVWYQARKEKRLEKIYIFKQLMATRNILDYETVKAINTIHIIFNDSKDVTEACVEYMNALKVEGEFNEALWKNVEEKEQKLIKTIAKNLEFENIDINVIQNKYNPNFLSYGRKRDAQMDININQLLGMAEKCIGNMPTNTLPHNK